MKNTTRSLLLLPLLLALAACHRHHSGPSLVPSGSIVLDATDAPFTHDLVGTASVRIDRIYVGHDVGPDAELLRLYEGPNLEIELTALRDGLTQELLQRAVPSGVWAQVRVHVVGAHLALRNGNVYDTDDGSLVLAPQDPNGYPVVFDPPIDTRGSASVHAVLDFDLARTFRPEPAGDPNAATSYRLEPSIHAAGGGIWGGLRGIVQEPDGAGGFQPVEDATVYILPAGETDTENAWSSTSTNALGSYAKIGVPPGAYDVRVVRGALEGLATSQTVGAGGQTIVDVVIE